jgi:hypothetical protein
MGTASEHLRKRVKDQGDRPTCVAFAVGALHEYWRELVVDQLGEIRLDLSPEFLYYGCKQRDKLAAAAGTTVDAASEWLKAKGQCLERLHPYQTANGPLQKPNASAFSDGLSRTVDTLVRRQMNWQTLERDLGKQLPVVGVINLFKSSYRVNERGELTLPTPSDVRLGLHAVLFVEIEGKKADRTVLFLNSWGKKWGDEGIGRLSSTYFTKFCKQLWTIERRKA